MALIITGEGTASNTANAIVRRDTNGDFSAGTITANLTGNVSGSSTSCSGNASSVTNGVYTTGSYSDPSWISSIAASKVSGTVSSATSATNTSNVAVSSDTSTTTAYLSFVTATSGNNAVKVNSSITCNASLGTITAQATNARYADLAEKYVADGIYEPGTVLELGGSQEVTLAENETRRIAGVVSTLPGFLMNEDCQGAFIAIIALQGRVPCKIQGPVRKGDMMISAGNGRARACEEPKLGQVIGKSLEDFDGELGVIEVLVGRL
jgi:hypothetical protein